MTQRPLYLYNCTFVAHRSVSHRSAAPCNAQYTFILHPQPYLGGALERQLAGSVAEVLLRLEVQVQPQHGGVRHDGGGHRARGFSRREEGVPVVHDGDERVHADLAGTGHQPAHHIAATPVHRGQRRPHHLRKGEQQQHVRQDRHQRPRTI